MASCQAGKFFRTRLLTLQPDTPDVGRDRSDEPASPWLRRSWRLSLLDGFTKHHRTIVEVGSVSIPTTFPEAME